MKLSEIKLKNTLVEIIRGYSFCKSKGLFIKHLDLFDQFDIDNIYYDSYNTYKNGGVPTEEELLAFYVKDGQWSKTDDERADELEEFIEDLKANRSKHINDEYRQQIDEEIKENQRELNKMRAKRAQLFSNSCEEMAGRKLSDYYILKSFYRDDGLSNPFFSHGQINNMDDDAIGEYVLIYNELLKDINEQTIKKISISSSFQSFYKICDNPESFLRKPAAYLTFYQNILLSYGNVFKNIFIEHGRDIPREIRDDPDGILDFVNQKREVEKRSANKPSNTHFMGINSEKRNSLGLGTRRSFAEQLAHKDSITKEDIINIASR